MSEAALAAPRGNAAAEWVRTTFHLGVREVRTVLRTPAAFLPGLFIPLFFYFVQVGALSGFASRSGVPNYKAFQLPVAILFAVSNGGAGLNMVADIESGYFDKLVLTPASRLSLLLGAMGADFVRVLVQGLFVAVVALAAGLHFATGIGGMLAMVAMASVWGVAYSAIGFAIALKTGNSQATQSAFVLFFPFLFLTTAFAPLQSMSGWMRTAATYNPVTYILRGLRAFSMVGWSAHEIGLGLLAAVGVGLVTVPMALRALTGRLR
jgi:ABC-2 type transport system permease protein